MNTEHKIIFAFILIAIALQIIFGMATIGMAQNAVSKRASMNVEEFYEWETGRSE